MKPKIYKKPLHLTRWQRRLNPASMSDEPQEYASDAWVPKMITLSFDSAVKKLDIKIDYDPSYENEQLKFLISNETGISICYGLNTKRIFQITVVNVTISEFDKEIIQIQELLKKLAVEAKTDFLRKSSGMIPPEWNIHVIQDGLQDSIKEEYAYEA